jgi:hypothetical protein
MFIPNLFFAQNAQNHRKYNHMVTLTPFYNMKLVLTCKNEAQIQKSLFSNINFHHTEFYVSDVVLSSFEMMEQG